MFQELPEEIQLTLLLSGGQAYTVSVETDDLLLQQLFAVLMDWEGKRTRRLFQIPINQGQSVLAFPCDRLVGLVTEPPLILQQQETEQSDALVSQSLTTHPADRGKTSNPLISEYVQIDNFLTLEQHRSLLDYTLQHQSGFVSTVTSTGDLDYRQSVVLYSFPEFAQLISQRIQAVMPEVLIQLGLPPFSVNQIESQLTAHNDGNYYKIHNDNGSPDTASRELTYVYYFYQQPKPFSGGELRLYDSKVENNFYVQAETFRTVDPRNNSIVFFLSRYMHEVLPVRCPSKAFRDSRFTINGWVCRA